MAICLEASQLPNLLDYLEHELPKSFKVHGELKNHLLGKWPGMSYWVDSWPDPKVVFSKPLPGLTKSSYIDYFYNVYSTDGEAFEAVLRNTDLVDWSLEFFMFAGIDAQYRGIVEMLALEKGKMLLMRDDYSYLYVPAGSKLHKVALPEDLILTTITEEHVPAMAMCWKYSRPGAEPYIHCLVNTFPSCCLLNAEGQLVGCVLGQHYGVTGMLWVHPDYRGRGLAVVLMTAVAQFYPEPPYSIADVNNIPAQRLHEKIGYQRFPDYLITWMRFVDSDWKRASQIGMHETICKSEEAGEESAKIDSTKEEDDRMIARAERIESRTEQRGWTDYSRDKMGRTRPEDLARVWENMEEREEQSQGFDQERSEEVEERGLDRSTGRHVDSPRTEREEEREEIKAGMSRMTDHEVETGNIAVWMASMEKDKGQVEPIWWPELGNLGMVCAAIERSDSEGSFLSGLSRTRIDEDVWKIRAEPCDRTELHREVRQVERGIKHGRTGTEGSRKADQS